MSERDAKQMAPEPEGVRRFDTDDDVEGHAYRMELEPDGAQQRIYGDDGDIEGHQHRI